MDIIHEPAENGDPDQGSDREQFDSVLEHGFSGSVSKFALALGRPEQAVREILDGITEIDDDLMMKVRGIADERGLSTD